MKFTRYIYMTLLVLALFASRLLVAGTLDDEPFRVVVPTSEWRVDDSTDQSMGKDVFLVATISNTNTMLKSVVIKTVLEKASASALNEVCEGIRDTFANPAIKKISDADAVFLGYKARAFAYQVTQGQMVTYNEAIVFVTGNKAWTIAFVGRPDQKNEIKKMIGFFRKK